MKKCFCLEAYFIVVFKWPILIETEKVKSFAVIIPVESQQGQPSNHLAMDIRTSAGCHWVQELWLDGRPVIIWCCLSTRLHKNEKQKVYMEDALWSLNATWKSGYELPGYQNNWKSDGKSIVYTVTTLLFVPLEVTWKMCFSKYEKKHEREKWRVSRSHKKNLDSQLSLNIEYWINILVFYSKLEYKALSTSYGEFVSQYAFSLPSKWCKYKTKSFIYVWQLRSSIAKP